MKLEARVHERNLVKWAADKPEVVVFSADLTNSTEIGLFKETYPDRFYSFGMTEQNMMSAAGGMAREGFTPFVHTFAVFMYRRALDQIEMSIAYPNLKVRIFGFLPGITTPGGASHQAINDIGILRTVPNMTILETGDATEVESVLDVAQSIDGPVYIRQLRGQIPRLFKEPMRFGKSRVLSKGSDITLITSGIMTEEALKATAVLRENGVSIEHLHISTHKPFGDDSILDAIEKTKYGVISMENHTIIGGLGSSISELMAENGIAKRLIRIGLKDTYAHGGSKEYLMKYYGLNAMNLVKAVETLTGQKLNIKEEDLVEPQIDEIEQFIKSEDL
ncbi:MULTISPECIES: transketolase family protein [Pseudothermotoga]|jgi:transketolase|uniref:transketolase family protein n=2 Tax=Thermotogaceae TaxID=188709 RepID=UPI0004277F0F|nr:MULTISPECIES: transketolase C-terminal domain-containing protein [Pseudothermotoga]MDI3494508.1 transketolase [Pseudothermotoga sp.]MDK2884842.1 transketolase [Pseudothermotoga sp.]HBJ80326.1 transketolase [Pseudothermotoga sp.]